MTKSGSPSSYLLHVAALERRLSTDQALSQAVGGEFVAMGQLEYYLLRACGLRDDHLVVDVGCGSGRLAAQLAHFPQLRYVGCDVVPRLIAYAEKLVTRPDWKFSQTNGSSIPCGDGEADFACFFSVFTHLPQDDIFRYFREAHRVLKPGGVMVMSFLDFAIPAHWSTFLASVDGQSHDSHLNEFIAPDSIRAWAAHSGFDIRAIHPGNTSYIPLPVEVRLESGEQMMDAGTLGQSVAVLEKRRVGQINMTAGISTAATDIRNARSSDASLPPDEKLSLLPSALLNMSSRTKLLRGEAVTAGFVIGGNAPRRVLIRAVGPTLDRFGVMRPLANPSLAIYSSQGMCADGLVAWDGRTETESIFAKVGAFALPVGSKDSAAVLTLPPGTYSIVLKGATESDEGEVLLELYFVD